MKKIDLFKAYEKFELMEGRSPHSEYEFAQSISIEESVFYEHFSSLKHLKKGFLRGMMDEALVILDADENYTDFSAREKLLALFFTLFEDLKNHRSYLIHKYASNDPREVIHLKDDWKEFFAQLNARVENILADARSEDEIVIRPYISDHYSKAFKVAFTYVFKVWLKDESKDFETTDAAIEKTINLTFDLLGKGPLDALIDFGKFAIKTKVV